METIVRKWQNKNSIYILRKSFCKKYKILKLYTRRMNNPIQEKNKYQAREEDINQPVSKNISETQNVQ